MYPATAPLLCALLLPSLAAADESVGLAGILGGKALLIVDGGAPRTVAPGDSFKGIKVISTTPDSALLESENYRFTVRLGESPMHLGSPLNQGADTSPGTAPRPAANKADTASGRIVLTTGQGGHFFTLALINGATVPAMVDTGATLVVLSAKMANRIGLKYRNGRRYQSSTANGIGRGWLVQLNSLQVGDVTLYNVDAGVSEADMDHVLLGNTFLGRFQMTRNNDQMVLERRY